MSTLITSKQLGGVNSWINRRKNPSYYRSLGCIVANTFTNPGTENPDFAEFIGICLGDGGLTSAQLCITLNRDADRDYIVYVRNLALKLFSYFPVISNRKNARAITLVMTGVDLVKMLISAGLKIGNKVRQQVGVPLWISEDIGLATKCVRGLMDTDGCVFKNRYKVNGKYYQYKKIAFANMSQPLLKFVYETLKQLGFTPIYYQNKQVRLCSYKEVDRYMQIIGSSNQRLLKFFS